MTEHLRVLADANAGEYATRIVDSKVQTHNRLLVGTPCTGNVRVEWVQARVGQTIPTNWSWVQLWQYINGYMPLRYQVSDAQNLIIAEAVRGNYEWVMLWEHDVVPQPDALVRLNEYMKRNDPPVISGLYFTRSSPSEPMTYRGRGNGAYQDWQPGDLVWCDGVPTGFLLIHMSIIRAMWPDCREYALNGIQVREVFNTPRYMWFNPETGVYHTHAGTSDLEWCTRVIEGGYLAKAGWPQYQEMQYPFLVDTNVFCKHINPNGETFPSEKNVSMPIGVDPAPPEVRREAV
jgi:hypothetical protein